MQSLNEQKKTIKEKIVNEFIGKSATHNGECQYRGSEGKKCVIGLLIPDEMYSPTFEGGDCTVVNKYLNKNFSENPLNNFNLSLLAHLQIVHDTNLRNYMSLEEQKEILLDELENFKES